MFIANRKRRSSALRQECHVDSRDNEYSWRVIIALLTECGASTFLRAINIAPLAGSDRLHVWHMPSLLAVRREEPKCHC